jgi:hypothetical protein
MKRSSLGWTLALVAVAATLLIRCTDLTVNSGPNGANAVASGPDTPPIETDKDGVHDYPTPTPGSYEPVYPVTPPPPTETPRPG